jgi:hypothetical protein
MTGGAHNSPLCMCQFFFEAALVTPRSHGEDLVVHRFRPGEPHTREDNAEVGKLSSFLSVCESPRPTSLVDWVGEVGVS